MRNNPHLLVFIKSFTKNFMFLGLTSVDFYHPYTDLQYTQASSIPAVYPGQYSRLYSPDGDGWS